MRRIRGSRWAVLAYLVISAGGTVLARVLSANDVVFSAFLVTVIIVAVALGIWKVRRGGGPVRDVVARWRQRARARVDSAAKLHAEAPLAAGELALASFPAVLLALVATRSFGAKGVYLPAAADARWQLWCIAIAVAGAVVAVDYWFGRGTSLRALVTDVFTPALVAVTVALAASAPMLDLWRVESRPAWLCLLAAQFLWPFVGAMLGALVSERRKRLLSLAIPSPAQSRWLAEFGVEANHDLVLVSPGSRKSLVIKEIMLLTGLGTKKAMDLVENTPSLLMQHVTADRANKAKTRLEILGATLTETSYSAEI